jgi:L-threonylcarbamoyladenylate synthase
MTQSRARLVPSSDDSVVECAIRALENGELIVFPTDTVYGIGAAVDRPEAVARLYVAKGRPLDRPIPVLISDIEQVSRLARNVDANVERLVRAFWPGGLTLVVDAVEWLPREIVGDTGQVGLRMPDHPLALRLIDAAGGAIATTSANRSGEPAATNARDALEALKHQASLVIDDGPSPGGLNSTVVTIVKGRLRVLREGAIPSSEIAPRLRD